MCCTAENFIDRIIDVVEELKHPPPPVIPCQIEPPVPYATCCMTCPPPILAPTQPQPVKPLQMPCPFKQNNEPAQISMEEAVQKRYSNFYNNYNVDYHEQQQESRNSAPVKPVRRIRARGCEDYRFKKLEAERESPGCPTGFKPCSMKLKPPPGNHPCGIWCATIQPCPPKKKVEFPYDGSPENCKRPGCKHWKPKGTGTGECLYDCPCKAHCFNHPPGIKPGRREAGGCPPFNCENSLDNN